MKVFKFEKNSEHPIEHTVFSIKIEERKKINCIVINNPVESKCIYVVNHLVCKSIENKNMAHLIIANKAKELKDITTFGSLNVGYEYDREESEGNLEIAIVNIEKNKDIEMIEGHFLIILPGGNIDIKLEEPQEKMILQISLVEQNI